MTTLKNLKGTAIQFLAEDPVVYAGSWSNGGNLNTAKRQGTGFGTLTAGVYAGGTVPSPTTANVEEYNGTAWSEVNDMPSGSFALASASNAPQTSGIVFGGTNPANTGVTAESDSYDGTNWTEVAEMNGARKQLGGAGSSSTAAVAFGGNPIPQGAYTELWNGSAWTEVNDMNTKKSNMGCFGTSTAAMAAAGTDSPGTTTAVETWDGTNWTEVSELNTNRTRTSGAGTLTDGIIAAGGPPNSALTEQWNGSAWTEVGDVGTARHEAAGAGTGTAAFIAGGYTTTVVATTEEWSFPSPTATIVQEGQMWFNSSSSTLKGYGTAAGVPAGTWASGGALNTARQQGNGVGPQTANLFFGGLKAGPARAPETEEYNGTAWTEKNDLNTARDSMAAGGTTTAAITAFGSGTPATPPITNIAELWDGTSWTETTDANSLRYSLGGAGTQTDLIAFGGYITAVSNLVETWDGTSWTETTELNQAKSNIGSGGTSSTSALGFGGYLPGSPGHTANTEEWNGSSWTEVNNLNTSRYNVVGGGSVPGCLGTGGFTTTSVANVETWNGTSWTEQSEIATNRYRGGGGGSVVAGIFSGGGNPPTLYTNTEEWTVDAVVSTVTTS
jgi:hypothetical protein